MALDEGLIKKLSAYACVDEATTRRVCKALADMLTETPLFDFSELLEVNKPARPSVPIVVAPPSFEEDDQWLTDKIGEIAHLVDMHLPKEFQGTAWEHFSAMGVSRATTGQLDVSVLTRRLRKNIIL